MVVAVLADIVEILYRAISRDLAGSTGKPYVVLATGTDTLFQLLATGPSLDSGYSLILPGGDGQRTF